MLRGKTALITGSTSGIGLGIAEALAAAGVNLMLNGFAPDGTVAALRKRFESEHKIRTDYSPADMSRPEEIAAMMEQAVERFGSLDILINNAGIQHVAPIDEFPAERWDAILAINLSSAFHTIKAALPAMRERGWGRIVNIASAHGLVASPFKSAYVAAKHGVIGLTKTVALEAAGTGVTCNAVCPGFVLTPLVEKQIDDQAKAHGVSRDEAIRTIILQRQPAKQFAKIEEVAALTAFLCGDAAASITGASMSVDNGWTAQ